MFKNNEPPVSLFSFQDIITTLTGIMIFFLLILVINMLEITENDQKEQKAPVYTEWREVEKQNGLLKKQIREIKHDVNKYRQRLREIARQNDSSLTLEKSRLKDQIAGEQKEIEKTAQQLRGSEQRLQAETESNQALENEKKQLEKELPRLKDALKQCDELKAKIKELKKQIAERKKMVNISLDRNIDLKPLLVECSRNSINVFDPATKNVKKFSRRTPIVSDMIADVFKYLKGLSTSEYYFVFLIKPSAAGYFHFLKTQLQENIPGAKHGIEPILENEVSY